MARDDDRVGFRLERHADVARRVRSVDRAGDLAVGPRAAGGDLAGSPRTRRGGSRRCRDGRPGCRADRRPQPPSTARMPSIARRTNAGRSPMSSARRSGMPRAPGSRTRLIPVSLQPTAQRPSAVSNAIAAITIKPIIDSEPDRDDVRCIASRSRRSDDAASRPGDGREHEWRGREQRPTAVAERGPTLRIEAGHVRARRPDAAGERFPPRLEARVLDGGRQCRRLDLAEARCREQFGKVSLAGAGKARLSTTSGSRSRAAAQKMWSGPPSPA